MKDFEHEDSCPLDAVDRRLDDVHRHWHEAERAYFDPNSFRLAIQTAIQTLRTVTFLLQYQKRRFKNFESWYEPWQEKFRADKLMRWMVDARNRIEKQGDLKAHSFIRAEIMASYFEDGNRIEVPAELFQSPMELIQSIQTEELRKHVFKDGILRIQRRWVENSLPDYELLDAVGLAYGQIAELVTDAHRELNLITPFGVEDKHGNDSLKGRLPCMIGHHEAHTQNVWLATGDVISIEQEDVELNREHQGIVSKKYGLDLKEMLSSTKVSAEVTLDELYEAARKIFAVDGHHQTIVFLLKGQSPVSIQSLNLEQHGEKYLVMRMIANEVVKYAADGVVVVGEVWSAPFDSENPYRRAADAPDKKEYLSATLVTKTGNSVQLLAEINRFDDCLTLGETIKQKNMAQIAFAPIYAAWGCELPANWSNATNLGARDVVSDNCVSKSKTSD